MRQYAFDRNHAIVAILHDINQAMQYFDRLILVKEGKMVGDLSPGPEAISALEDLYDIQFDILSATSGTNFFFPRARSVVCR